MARKLDVACPNLHCRSFGKVGLRNVIRKGKQLNGAIRYQCTDCKRTFGRTMNTPFFHKHLKKSEIVRICKMLSEKMSFRSIARVTGRHLDTIRGVADAVAKHCKKYNEFFVKDLGLSPIEVDEMWSFVKKKKRTAKHPASA
jgi:transposase-like protein